LHASRKKKQKALSKLLFHRDITMGVRRALGETGITRKSDRSLNKPV